MKTRGRGGFEKGFVLWPFYTWRRSPTSRAFFLFPFYGRDVGPEIRHTTIMFPFYMRTRDSRTGLVDTTLFPFYRRAKGAEQVDVRRYWPIHMSSREEWNYTTFTAWPIWRQCSTSSECTAGCISRGTATEGSSPSPSHARIPSARRA